MATPFSEALRGNDNVDREKQPGSIRNKLWDIGNKVEPLSKNLNSKWKLPSRWQDSIWKSNEKKEKNDIYYWKEISSIKSIASKFNWIFNLSNPQQKDMADSLKKVLVNVMQKDPFKSVDYNFREDYLYSVRWIKETDDWFITCDMTKMKSWANWYENISFLVNTNSNTISIRSNSY